jgi:G:T/U-mismatch repair DNA glycosylase
VINPGLYSGAVGHHFARPGNRFWPTLYAAGFTDRLLSPLEERELLKKRYGITNIVDRATARADELSVQELIDGARRLQAKVLCYRPRVVAIVGISEYRVVFTWSAEECITCLQREDLSVDLIAREIGKYCLDPNLPAPDSLKARFGSLTEEINIQEMWALFGTTATDHAFKTYEPSLAAYAPAALAALIRLAARQITERRDVARRQLSINLVSHYLILGKEEKEAVQSAWEGLVSGPNGWSKADEVAEMFLFKLVLAELDGDAQLAALLRRPEIALDLVNYKGEFLPIKEWDLVRTQFANATGAKDILRVLWFLSAHPSVIPHDLLNTSIVPLLNHNDGTLRSLVLEIIYEAKEANAIDSVVQGGWGWDPSGAELQNHWGSLIICEHGESLSFDEMCSRVPLNYLGYAIMRRGNQRAEVQVYAELIHRLWLRLNTNGHDLPVDLPRFTVNASASGEVQHVSRLGLAEDSSTRSITLLNAHLTWGGLEEAGDLDSADWNAEAVIERQQQLWEIIDEVIEQQRATGNTWFGQAFHDEALDKVIEERPDLVAEWVYSSLPEITICRSSSFFSRIISGSNVISGPALQIKGLTAAPGFTARSSFHSSDMPPPVAVLFDRAKRPHRSITHNERQAHSLND